MTENMPTKTQTGEKILSRELAKIKNEEHREAALAVADMHSVFGEILPASSRDNIKPFILSAVRYIRRKLSGEVFTPMSFADAVFDAAQYGLPIDGRLAYALPFAEKEGNAKTLVFVPDYKGIIAVAKQKGIVRDVRAYVVCEHDDFQLPGEDSSEPGVKWSFRPKTMGDRGKVVGALCVLEFPDGRRHPEFMPFEEIEQVRKSAKTQKVWSVHWNEMAKKTVTKRAFKIHQDDPEFSALLGAEDEFYQHDVVDVLPRNKKTRTLELPKVKTWSDNEQPTVKTPVDYHQTQAAGIARTAKEATVDAERVGLKKAFKEAWELCESVGLDPAQQFGITDEDGDHMGPNELTQVLAIMNETTAAMQPQEVKA